jgi:hypothetical protein
MAVGLLRRRIAGIQGIKESTEREEETEGDEATDSIIFSLIFSFFLRISYPLHPPARGPRGLHPCYTAVAEEPCGTSHDK